MLDILLPICVLGMLLLLVDQVRRLISHAIINGTIRQALKSDPTSVPLLVAKLDDQRRPVGTLVAWALVSGACVLAVAAIFESGDGRKDALEIAAIAATVGIAVFAYTRWAKRAVPKL